MKLSIAISPCPNDTFIFGALALDLINFNDESTFANESMIEPEFTYLDIEELNRHALSKTNDITKFNVTKYDVTKLSFAAWLHVRNEYELLSCGAALGKNCGPLIVAKNDTVISSGRKNLTVALPGEHTTATLLFRLNEIYKLKADKTYKDLSITEVHSRYDEIMNLVLEEKADLGVIIHESRFLAKDLGLTIICDLGQWWQDKTGLPIPLGCLAARKTLSPNTIKNIEKIINKSISFARKNKTSIMGYIKKHAIETDETIINKHIDTFVNDQSICLDDEGEMAVKMLEKLAIEAGLIG